MVEVAKTLSFFSHNSSKYICNTQPQAEAQAQPQAQPQQQRENKKRKGVHFDEEITASTSDYLLEEGKQWKHIASYFNLEENNGGKHDHESMNELLDLCNWHDDCEKNPELDEEFHYSDDSDDEIPYAAFASTCSNPTYPTPPLSQSSGTSSSKTSSMGCVSSLRLTSQLCLKSSNNLVVKRQSILRISDRVSDDEIVTSNEKEELELAFQGIMSSSPSEYDLISKQDSMNEANESAAAKKTNEDEEDFWGEVEF